MRSSCLLQPLQYACFIYYYGRLGLWAAGLTAKASELIYLASWLVGTIFLGVFELTYN